MIDPLEAIIAYLRANANLAQLTDDRIAAKHKFGEGWQIGHSAIVVRLDGGTVDIYAPHNEVTLDIRCYAASQFDTMTLWRRLRQASVETRVVVPTREGNALIYFMLPIAYPSLLFDPQINADFAFCPFRADIAQEPVGSA